MIGTDRDLTHSIDWSAMTDWITITEAAQMSGYNPDYLRRVLRQGKVSAEKKGTMWWIDKSSLEAYLQQAASLGTQKHSQGIKPPQATV